MKMQEKMWAIMGNCGLYCGTRLRRSDAIYQHCEFKGKTWKECRKQGDRAVKILVTILDLEEK